MRKYDRGSLLHLEALEIKHENVDARKRSPSIHSFLKSCFMCMGVLSASMSLPSACSTLRGQKAASDPLELELLTAVSCPVVTGNGTRVLCEYNLCS